MMQCSKILISLIVMIFIPVTIIAKETKEVKERKITITEIIRDITIRQAFEQIESQTNFTIAYNQTRFDVDQIITEAIRDVTVKEALTMILKQTGFTYKIMGSHVIITDNISKASSPRPKEVNGNAVSLALAQQGFRVSVLNDAKEPLPHAYVYVNDRAVAVADSLGRAVIPKDKLKIGDTISVSYVATEPQSVVFDQDIRTKGEYKFILPEIYGALLADAVVIRADVEKLYRKYVKERDAYRHGSIWVSHFLTRVNSTDNSMPSASVDGYLKIGLQWPHFANDLPIGITTLDDTTGLSPTIEYHLRAALNNNLTALHLTKDPEYFGTKGNLSYLGKDEHHRIFRLSYSDIKPGITYQVLLKSDIGTRDIREIIVDIANLNDGSTTYSKSTIREIKRGLAVRYVPIHIEYRFKYNNRTQVDITLSNIDLKAYKWDMYSKIYRFTDEVKEFGALLGLRSDWFRVSVHNDIKEPIPHAYIYVNGRAMAVTDTLGWARISTDNLKLGDTISVSYIACEDQSVIFIQEMLIGGEYQFVMPEILGILQADVVTVRANIKRQYRKGLPLLRDLPCVVNDQYGTHFTMNVTKPGDSLPSYWIAGRLEGVYTSTMHLSTRGATPRWFYRTVAVPGLNPDPAVLDSLQRHGISVGFVNNIPLKIVTSDDTTGVSRSLKYFLPRALHATHLALLRIYDPEPEYKELAIYPEARVNYGYLGKDEHHKTFRLTYSGHRAGTVSKIEVTSDVSDHYGREVVGATLSFLDLNNNNSYYVKIKTKITKQWHVPTAVEYSIKESDGMQVNITMSNISQPRIAKGQARSDDPKSLRKPSARGGTRIISQ